MRLFLTIFICWLWAFSASGQWCGDGNCDTWYGEDQFNCSIDCYGYCGDGVCGPGEDCSSCSLDCYASPCCGNSTCEAGEDNSTCPGDCPAVCNNGLCEPGENCSNCPGDCGPCPVCGDGICNGLETSGTCPGDCGLTNPTYLCYTGTPLNTPTLQATGCCGFTVQGYANAGGYNCTSTDCANCAGTCGNGICDGAEDCYSCPGDCGACAPYCGDGICDVGETCCNCSLDCGGGYCGGGHGGMQCFIQRPAQPVAPPNSNSANQMRYKSGSVCQTTMNSLGVHSYVITYSHCASGSCPAPVTQQYVLVAPPSISINSSNGTSFSGTANTTLTANCSGDCTGLTYTWSNGGGTGQSMSVNGLTSTTTYSVTATNHSGNGCQTVQNVTIDVIACPTLNVTLNGATPSTHNMCSYPYNATLNCTNCSSPSYAWAGGCSNCNVSGNTTNTVTFTGAGGGGAAFTVTDAGCSTVYNSISFQDGFMSGSTLTPSTTQAICEGQSATFFYTGNFSGYTTGLTYNWSNGGGSSSSATYSPTSTTNYTFTGTNDRGCTASIPFTINVNPQPTVSIVPTNTSICGGGSSTLNTNVTNCAGCTYQWDNGAAATANPTVSPAGTTTYNVTVTNSGGCSQTASTTINVSPVPTVSIVPTNTSICDGASTTLNTNVTNCAGCTYQWDNGAAATANPTVTPAGTTTYNVTVTNSGGCSQTASTTINVSPVPTVSVVPTNTSICNGGTTTLNTNVTNCAGCTYQWDNGAAATANPTVSPASTTTYNVTVTNSGGCSQTASATINVSGALSPTITATAAAICSGASTTLGTTGVYSTYLWTGGATTPTITVNTAGTYFVTVTSGACSGSSSLAISISSNPTPGISGTTTFCAGGSTTLTASGGISYLWSSGQNTAAVSVNTAGTFTVTVTDANGCTASTSTSTTINANPSPTIAGTLNFCAGGNTTLTASGGVSYVWSSAQNTAAIAVTTANTYTVTATDGNGCQGTTSATVIVNPLPTPTFTGGNNDAICVGGGTTLSLTQSYSAYSWNTTATTSTISVSPASTTIYTVTVTDANGCINTATKTVTVGSSLTATITPASPSFCPSSGVTLGTAAGYSIYSWSTGETTPTIVRNTAGTVTVTVTDAGGCTGTGTTSVTAATATTVSFVGGSSETICTSSTTTLTLSSAYSSYQWSGGQTTPTITANSAGVYAVTVTDANGCTATASKVISVGGALTVNFTGGASQNWCAGSNRTISLTAGYISYQWSGGQTTATITATGAGSYTVTVSNGSCTGTGTVSITSVANPTASVSVSGSPICYNTNATATSIVAGGLSPYTYAWQSGGTSATNTFVVPGSGSSYTQGLTVTDANSCTTTAVGNYTVTACGGSTTITASNSVVCSGSAVVLTVINPPVSPTYLWSTGQTTSSISANPTATTNYAVSVYSNSTLSNTFTQTVIVPASSISIALNKTTLCGMDTATISVTVGSACPTCTYTLYNISGTQIQTVTGLPSTVTIANPSLYYARLSGCSAISNVVSLAQSTLNPTIAAIPDTVLCGSGDTSTLVASGNCSSCSYVWRRNGTVIAGQTSNSLRVGQNGTYQVSITDGGTGCSATTQRVVNATNTRIATFSIPSTIGISGSSQDLSTMITFSPAPPSPVGAFGGNGVSGNNFSPALAGVGTHFITYSYTENGCVFSATDTIQVVSNSSAATFTNINADGADSIFANSEACIGDTLVVTVSNYLFNPLQIEFSNGMGGFLTAQNVFNSNVAIDGNNRFNGTFMTIVPGAGKTGTMRLRNGATIANLGAIVVNNPDVSVVGLPNPACSNGNYNLTGIPSGGVFSALYSPYTTTSPSLISGTNFLADMVTGYSGGSVPVRLRYTYTPRYGNGSGGACPTIVRDSNTVVYDVRINSVTFFNISNSETNTRLDSLINAFSPASSQSLNPVYSGVGVSFSSPNYFYNAQQAGVGSRQIMIQVSNNVCTNTDTGFIQVINRPVLQGLAAQYCNISGNDTINRDPSYAYSSPGGGVINNDWSINATNYTGNFNTPQCSPAPASYCYIFQPNLGTGAVVMTNIYRNFVGGGRSYIVGRSTDTILIGSGSSVQVQTRDTLYCAGSGFRQVQLSPATGNFVIRQLNGAAPRAVDFSTVVSNGTAVVNIDSLYMGENSNVRYRMVYTFGAAGCSNSDSLDFTIPRPADASFTMARNNTGLYCEGDAADTFRIVNAAQNLSSSSLFTVNSIPAFDRTFQPTGVGATRIINHTISNTAGCVSLLRDTFTVNPRPVISFVRPNNRYCEYEPAMTVQGLSSPNTGLGQLSYQINGGAFFNTSNPANLLPAALIDSGRPTRVIFRYQHTDGNGCSSTGFDSTLINPRPEVSIAPLQPLYCQDVNLTVFLTPSPQGPTGLITTNLLSGSSSNVLTTPLASASFRPIQLSSERIIYTYTDPNTTCVGADTAITGVNPASAVVPQISSLSGQNRFCFVGDTIKFVGRRGGAAGSIDFYSNATTTNGGVIQEIINLSADTAYFVPNQADAGALVMTYALTSGGCSKISQMNITVNPLPSLVVRYNNTAGNRTAIAQNDSSLCEYDRADVTVYDANINPPSALPTSTYTFSGAGYYVVNGQNNLLRFINDSIPMNSRIGNHLISVTHTDLNGCINTVVDSIAVRANPVPTISGLNADYCVGSPADTIFGVPSNGTWAYVNNINNPIVSMTPPPNVQNTSAVIGISNNNTTGVGIAMVTYYTQINACQNEYSQSVTVNPPLDIDLSGMPASVCSNTPPFAIIATTSSPVAGIRFAYYPDYGANTQPIAAAIFNDSIFDPSALGGRTGGGIFAFYSDPATGCADNSNRPINIIAAPNADISFLNATGPDTNVYCIDPAAQNTATIRGLNNGGTSAGDFYSYRGWLTGGNYNGQSAVSLSLASTGTDTIRFIAQSGSGGLSCYDTTTSAVIVRGLPPNLTIAGLDTLYCQLSDALDATAFPAPTAGSTTGNLALYQGNTLLGPIGNSNEARQVPFNNSPFNGFGAYRIAYTFRDEFACQSTAFANFQVRPNPVANFTRNGYCVGDSVILTAAPWNSPTNSDSIVAWNWLFNNQAITNSPTAIYPVQLIAGNYTASLVVVTNAGCSDAQVQANLPIYRKPFAGFQAVGGCQNTAVVFDADSTYLIPGTDSLTSASWNFGQGSIPASIVSRGVVVQDIANTYQQPGIYYPSITLVNQLYCTTTDTIRLVVSPTVNLYERFAVARPPFDSTNLIPYFNDFELDNPALSWLPAQESSLWNRGWADTVSALSPSAAFINTLDASSPYQKVWTTAQGIIGAPPTIPLDTFTNFNTSEASWLYSPCFDFRYSERPMIKFDYTSDMRFNVDGAALEYYDKNTNQWLRLGRHLNGVNWYNSPTIYPLSQIPENGDTLGPNTSILHGWTDTVNWQTARYRLDQFEGDSSVRFRMVFKALYVTSSDNSGGFAFDNVWIGERQRNVLVENFTYSYSPQLIPVNRNLYNLILQPYNYDDVSLVQYHTQNVNLPDPFRTANDAYGGSARDLLYGGGGTAGAAVVNGDSSWSGPTANITQQILDGEMLLDPFFSIWDIDADLSRPTHRGQNNLRISVDIPSQTVSVKAIIKAEQDLPFSNYRIMSAVVEQKAVNVSNTLPQPDTFRSVFRTMLPNADGFNFVGGKNWTEGETFLLDVNNQYNPNANPAINPSLLFGVIWVEDRVNDKVKVLHSTTTVNIDARINTAVQENTSNTDNSTLFSAQLYPNPAQDYFNLSFEQPLEQTASFHIFDMNGVIIQTGEIQQGLQSFQFNTYNLPQAPYVISVQTPTHRIQRKFVIIRP